MAPRPLCLCVCLFVCLLLLRLVDRYLTNTHGWTDGAETEPHACANYLANKTQKRNESGLSATFVSAIKRSGTRDLVQLPSIIEPLARVWLEGISCLMAAVCQSLLHMLTEDVRVLADKSDSHAQAAFLFQRPGMVWRGCHRAWI